MGGRRSKTEEGDNTFLESMETHVEEQRISQYGGRADDLVMSTRAQHDCGGMNDGKTGLWACCSQCLDWKRGVLEVSLMSKT